MQVLHRGTCWLRFWSQLEKKDEDNEAINEACRRLERTALHMFTEYG